jgi:peptidoglycan/xylan/chitin deacetylase (PgdA/CDA1 family)
MDVHNAFARVTGARMKKIISVVAVCLVAILIVSGIAGVSVAVANNRLLPVYKVDRSDKKLSISFDAAWGADKTRQIMDICEKYDAKVTFFLVGFWMKKYPDLVAEIASRGHEIGTHSQTHPQMSKLSAEKVDAELSSTLKTIFNLTGKSTKLFRPPFGDYNNTLISGAAALGLQTIQWSIDSHDWMGLSGREIAVRCQKMDSGDIILCHNNSDHILEALPIIFEMAKLKGLSFVPIGELIYTENYIIDTQGLQKLVEKE